MEVKICKNCRRLFNYLYGPQLCPACISLIAENQVEPVEGTRTVVVNAMTREEEIKYQQVKDYIMLNPKSTVAQIAEINGITASKLFDWIREERLEFSVDSPNGWFTCERCGVRIKSGRLCNNCRPK